MERLTDAQVDEILSKVYHDAKARFGRDRLYSLVRESGVSRRQVAAWLRTQEVHQLFHPTRARRTVRPTIPLKPGTVAIDIVDMSSSPALSDEITYHWILTAIDLHTKEARAFPLPNKEARTVAAELPELIRELRPHVLRSDNGSEFKNAVFKAELKKYGERRKGVPMVKQVFSSPSTPQSNGAIERFNRTLKRLIQMDQLQDAKANWVESLRTYVDAYNASVHRTIGTTPLDAKTVDPGVITERIAAHAPHHLNDSKLDVGDLVRLRIRWDPSEKKGEPWSRDLFEITKAVNPRSAHLAPYYRLRLIPPDEGTPAVDLRGIFYREDVQPVDAPARKLDSEHRWEITSIVRPSKQGGVDGYIVNWKPTYGIEWKPSWVRKEDLPVKLRKRFDKEEKEPGAGAAPKRRRAARGAKEDDDDEDSEDDERPPTPPPRRNNARAAAPEPPKAEPAPLRRSTRERRPPRP